MGALTTLRLWLLGARFAPPLGLLTALLNFIPILGPLIAAVPAILFALLQGPAEALHVAGLYLAIQSVEGYLIDPLIQQRAVSVPAAVILVSQVLLGVLVGPLGVALAPPLAAAGLVVVEKLYVEDVLGDRAAQPDADGDDRPPAGGARPRPHAGVESPG